MLKKIIFEIVITDKEILEDYKDVHRDIILDDFIRSPSLWIKNSAAVTVRKVQQK